MVRILLPAGIGLISILSLCFYEGYAMKDRWGAPGLTAEDLTDRFEHVPMNIGDWRGEDLPVDEVVRKTAGAIGYVSRRYSNSSTGQEVTLWLIVGHSRDIVRHQPTTCYPSSGFRQVGSRVLHYVDMQGDKEAAFYTAKFEKEDATSRRIERVFWTFNHPEENQWEAPDGMQGARARYGLARALYKLYFTSVVRADEDTIEDNSAIEFAEEMLPALDKVLFVEDGQMSAPSSDAPAADEAVTDELLN